MGVPSVDINKNKVIVSSTVNIVFVYKRLVIFMEVTFVVNVVKVIVDVKISFVVKLIIVCVKNAKVIN